jgi:uncharacterized protein (TIGR03089 family)
VPTEPLARTAAGLLAHALATDPARPLITQYDDATGERIELSATTLDNWVAKTANLLQDSGVEPGARAAVLLPPHWQGAAILVGCWSAGLTVAYGAALSSPDVGFAGPDRLDEALATGAGDVYGLSLAPLAAPLRELPPGVTDYATEVRGHADRFVPYAPVTPDAPAFVDAQPEPLSHAELVAAATARADELGVTAGDRLLVADHAGRHPRPLDWLLAPLVAGATVVLCRNPDAGTATGSGTAADSAAADPGAAAGRLAKRAADERVTATLGVAVPGLRRADTP